MKKNLLPIILLIFLGLAGGYVIATQTSNEPKSSEQTDTLNKTKATATLDLSGKGLTSLGDDVTNRKDVRVLNLSNNQLTTLPAEIGNMTNLEELNVENNRLQTLPPELAKLINLKRADFSNNRLQSLPVELGELTGLEFLNLGGYDSSKTEAQDIKSKLANTEVKF